VAIATFLAALMRFSALFYYSNKYISIKLNYKQNLKVIIASFFFLVSTVFIKKQIYRNYTNVEIINLGINISIIFVLSGIIYSLILLALGVITERKIKYLKEIVLVK
jgi:hypothetical protein